MNDIYDLIIPFGNFIIGEEFCKYLSSLEHAPPGVFFKLAQKLLPSSWLQSNQGEMQVSYFLIVVSSLLGKVCADNAPRKHLTSHVFNCVSP